MKKMADTPTLNNIVELVSCRHPLQRKALKKHIESCDPVFIEKAESYLKNYVTFLRTKGISLDYIVDSYLQMAKDILVEQTVFLRSGKYRYDNLKTVIEKVYANKEFMFRYMLGVALSQFLWPNHKDMFLFFAKNIRSGKGKSYLEIGPGHGLFFMESLSAGKFSRYCAVDISEASLTLTKDFVNYCMDIGDRDVAFLLADINESRFTEKYDFITMGEVLEHVEDPRQLLCAIRDLLSDDGRAMISTCANAPVVDHIYLYASAAEIRKDIRGCGLDIVDEIIIYNDGSNVLNAEKNKANLSYACMVRRGPVGV